MTVSKVEPRPREYGIDLLRLVAMLYIVVLHTVGLGGLAQAAVPGTGQYYLSWFLQMWVYCAVDIFALISGYVGYTPQPRAHSGAGWLRLWLQVVSLSVAAQLAGFLLTPQSVSLSSLVRMFLPVTANTYWYFTAYTGLFLLIPLLNAAVRGTGEDRLRRIFVVAVALFSLYSTLGDRWRLVNGFSMIWLAVLYLLGAIMRKCGFGRKIGTPWLILGILLCGGMSFGWKLWENAYGYLLGHSLVEQTYLAPTHLLGAMLHICLFSRLRPGSGVKKCLAFAGPGAFAVYILNCHPVILEAFVVDRFARYAQEPAAVLAARILGFGIVFVAVSVSLDWLRRKIFAVCKIDRLTQWAADQGRKLLDRLAAPWLD